MAGDGPLPVVREANIQDKYLAAIRSGAKTVEGRLRRGSLGETAVGDTLLLSSSSDQLKCLVVRVSSYATFADMLAAEGLAACLPGVLSIPEGAELYRAFPGYSEGERLHGVVALQLQLRSEYAGRDPEVASQG